MWNSLPQDLVVASSFPEPVPPIAASLGSLEALPFPGGQLLRPDWLCKEKGYPPQKLFLQPPVMELACKQAGLSESLEGRESWLWSLNFRLYTSVNHTSSLLCAPKTQLRNI